MLENLLIGLLFVGAMTYLGSQFRQSFSKKSTGCAKGCGSCGAIDSHPFDELPTIKQS